MDRRNCRLDSYFVIDNHLHYHRFPAPPGFRGLHRDHASHRVPTQAQLALRPEQHHQTWAAGPVRRPASRWNRPRRTPADRRHAPPAAAGPQPALGRADGAVPLRSAARGRIRPDHRRARPGQRRARPLPNGATSYGITSRDIDSMPQGSTSPMTDVLAQMPGVAIDQNQQIHIRDTEGPQFQYQINGVLVPLDINTNPPFISMINPMFIDSSTCSMASCRPLQLRHRRGGRHPDQGRMRAARRQRHIMVGQRDTFQPSVEYGGCGGRFSYYVSGLYNQDDTAFSSATPGPDAYHDHRPGPGLRLLLLPARSRDHRQPDPLGFGQRQPTAQRPRPAPQFTLAGANTPASAGHRFRPRFPGHPGGAGGQWPPRRRPDLSARLRLAYDLGAIPAPTTRANSPTRAWPQRRSTRMSTTPSRAI